MRGRPSSAPFYSTTTLKEAIEVGASSIWTLVALGCGLAIGSTSVLAQAGAAKKDELPVNKRWQQSVGDWVVVCAEGQNGRKSCAMSQTLNNAKTRQMLASWAISRDSNGKTSATVTVPMGVLVSVGLRAGADEKSAFEVPFRTCIAQGCVATFDVSNQLIAQLSKADKFSFVTRTVQEQPLTVEFSLRGFQKAHEILMQESK